jgi:hypothetical protein
MLTAVLMLAQQTKRPKQNMVGETKMSQLVGCCAGSEIW